MIHIDTLKLIPGGLWLGVEGGTGPYEIQGIEPKLAVCKAIVLPAILSLWLLPQIIFILYPTLAVLSRKNI